MVEYPVQDFEYREEEKGYNLGYSVGQKIKEYDTLDAMKRELEDNKDSYDVTVALAGVLERMGVDIEDLKEELDNPEQGVALTRAENATRILIDIIYIEQMTIRRELRQVSVTYPSD